MQIGCEVTAVEYGQMLECVFAALRRLDRQREFPLHELASATFRVAVDDLGYFEQTPGRAPQHFPVTSQETRAYQDVVNDLLRVGVLSFSLPFIPGSSPTAQVYLTQHGRDVISASPPGPYDPDGYIRDLRQATGELDEVVVEYLGEALATFRRGCPKAAIVMIGVASERLADMMEEALIECARPEVKAAVEDSKLGGDPGMTAKTRLNKIRGVFEALRKGGALKAVPWVKEASGDVELLLDAIRRARNDSGHPSLIVVPGQTAFSTLAMFPAACKHAYDIIGWLRETPPSDA
jgi:hypothetical protein